LNQKQNFLPFSDKIKRNSFGIKIKVVYLHCQTTTTGRFPRTIKRKSKRQQQFTTVYYTQQKKLIAISALKSTVLLTVKRLTSW